MNAERMLLPWLLPVFMACAALEWWWLAKRAHGSLNGADVRARRGSLDGRESLASLAIAFGQPVSRLAATAVWGGVVEWFWLHRVATVPLDTVWGLALLFFGTELCYYAYHRAGHEIRWFWASHCVHHSPEHMNLTAAYRLGWTAGISGAALFFVPMIVLGFAPIAVFAVLGLNLLWQFWLHTELVPKLGWFEWVFNTPSHHRVHHASNPRYLDTNYGGILIVYDRLFGSFAEEDAAEPCRYGLVTPVNSHNPLRIAFHDWMALVRDLAAARSLRAVLGALFGPPGWQADGLGPTTKNLRRGLVSAPATHPLTTQGEFA